jgi:hypothetical protein
MENYGTSEPLKASPEKSQILSCDIVANERYGGIGHANTSVRMLLYFSGMYVAAFN